MYSENTIKTLELEAMYKIRDIRNTVVDVTCRDTCAMVVAALEVVIMEIKEDMGPDDIESAKAIADRFQELRNTMFKFEDEGDE